MRLVSCLVVMVALLASCHKSHVSPGSPGLKGVYAAGWTQDSIGRPLAATEWKDGVRSILPNPIAGLGGGAVATAVTSNGYDVYIAGYAFTAKSDTSAVYWKNGVPTILGPGLGLAIAVNGQDVYVAGVNDTLDHACFWKNGARGYLGSNVATIWVQCIGLQGNNLFIGGSVDTLGSALACYWENGRPVLLGHGYVTSSAVWGMAISGRDIYFAGEADDRLNVPAASACYWKNGVLAAMSHPLSGLTQGECTARAIAVNGTDVYLAGTAWIQQGGSGVMAPVYWKDSVPTLLDTVGVQLAGVETIAVDSASNDVYVGGWYQGWGAGAGVGAGIGSGTSQPAIWKNGRQILTGNMLGAVNGITVVKE